MSEAISTYLQDHLAGASFAVSLLRDLCSQKHNKKLAAVAADVLREIEADRKLLDAFVTEVGAAPAKAKAVMAYIGQKISRTKLNMCTPLGRFQADEMLTLGVLGKLAMWRALLTLRSIDERVNLIDLDNLCARAEDQHRILERYRLELAPTVFLGSAKD